MNLYKHIVEGVSGLTVAAGPLIVAILVGTLVSLGTLGVLSGVMFAAFYRMILMPARDEGDPEMNDIFHYMEDMGRFIVPAGLIAMVVLAASLFLIFWGPAFIGVVLAAIIAIGAATPLLYVWPLMADRRIGFKTAVQRSLRLIDEFGGWPNHLLFSATAGIFAFALPLWLLSTGVLGALVGLILLFGMNIVMHAALADAYFEALDEVGEDEFGDELPPPPTTEEKQAQKAAAKAAAEEKAAKKSEKSLGKKAKEKTEKPKKEKEKKEKPAKAQKKAKPEKPAKPDKKAAKKEKAAKRPEPKKPEPEPAVDTDELLNELNFDDEPADDDVVELDEEVVELEEIVDDD